LPARVYVGAFLSALLVGIGVNALVLQHSRHPAPLFAPAPPKAPAAATPSPAPAQTEAAPAPLSAAAPLAPPAPPARVLPSDTPRRAPDQIGDLLREETQTDESRLIIAAQTALAKLGYPVKPDGAVGASTQQALRDFERSHGLPVTIEISPHLVKQLASAARAAGR
jgi:peptidoglycan hydrolase-like protein with peptidoglycan-binding domain